MLPILIIHSPFSCHVHPALIYFPLAGVYVFEKKECEETKYEAGTNQVCGQQLKVPHHFFHHVQRKLLHSKPESKLVRMTLHRANLFPEFWVNFEMLQK